MKREWILKKLDNFSNGLEKKEIVHMKKFQSKKKQSLLTLNIYNDLKIQ